MNISAPASVPCNDSSLLSAPLHGFELPRSNREFLFRNGYCTLNVPEFHDWQRLSDKQVTRDYQGVAFSFAYPIPAASAQLTHAGFDNTWINVAEVTVVGGVGGPNDNYRALNLRPGDNCVFLRHQHIGGQEKWIAVIGQPSGMTCGALSGRIIHAVDEGPIADPAHIPTVTRWMEGPGRKPLLGVRCGDRWCVIGPGGNALRPVHEGHPSAPTSHKWTVRGWHDEQTLGVPDASASNGIRQTGPRLSLVPDDTLERVDLNGFIGSNWVKVATVIVPTETELGSKYSSRPGWNFAVGVNTIELRASDPNTWEMRLTNNDPGRCPSTMVNGGCIYKQVTRHSHNVSYIPGTARWRWDDNDEEMWVRCGLGCCVIQPD